MCGGIRKVLRDGLCDTEDGLAYRSGFVHVGLEVAVEPVACSAFGKIVVLLDALEDFAHVVCTPRGVSCDVLDVVPVAVRW